MMYDCTTRELRCTALIYSTFMCGTHPTFDFVTDSRLKAVQQQSTKADHSPMPFSLCRPCHFVHYLQHKHESEVRRREDNCAPVRGDDA